MAIWRNERRATIRDRDVPVWRQALEGIGLVTAGALLAVAGGAVMSAVVTWLF